MAIPLTDSEKLLLEDARASIRQSQRMFWDGKQRVQNILWDNRYARGESIDLKVTLKHADSDQSLACWRWLAIIHSPDGEVVGDAHGITPADAIANAVKNLSEEGKF